MKEFQISDLTKTYGEKSLFNQLSFSIKTGDKIGLIGVNGTGKTSLLNILAVQDLGDEGNFKRPQNYHIGYLSQQTELPADLTVLEAVFQGDSPLLQAVRGYELALANLAIDGAIEEYQIAYNKAEERMNKEDAWSADTNAKTILMQLGISDLSQKISSLSGGQKKRVGLAQVLIQEPDLLLLDEPTNHLDYQAIEWLETYLAHYHGALVLVTHDRYFLDRVTNRIFELSFGQLHEYKGNYQTYLAAKAEREEVAKAQEHKRHQLYKQELAWMRAGVKARGTKQEARKERFHDLKDNLKQVKEDGSVEITLGSQRLGKKVLVVEDAFYAINQDKKILDNFNLLVQGTDRIGITGKNGAGKSTLLNILAGRIPLESGLYQIGDTVNLAYYTQENEDMDPNKRMIQYLQEVAEEVRQADGTSISVADMLERFLFPRSSHGTIIGKLSGGEKRRLFLLKLLIAQPNVLLLDEPTNDLDIDTLTVLEDYISQFNGAVIAVSHDRYFLDKVAEKLLVFKGDGIISEYYGNMSGYLASQKEVTTIENKLLKKEVIPEKEATKEKTKLSYHEKKEWESIEQEIEDLETTISRLTEEMNHQGSNFSQLQALQDELTASEIQLEDKLNRWEYLSEFA